MNFSRKTKLLKSFYKPIIYLILNYGVSRCRNATLLKFVENNLNLLGFFRMKFPVTVHQCWNFEKYSNLLIFLCHHSLMIMAWPTPEFWSITFVFNILNNWKPAIDRTRKYVKVIFSRQSAYCILTYFQIDKNMTQFHCFG